ncbi:baseplate wedge tail fiber connector [Synechococcus phage ACG-2014d]|uniref:Baseplate wedge tail fiber connector n=1 Tax=Synechococcus phage ACG-2014d TaxID=1493509 RepID=A0A0E3HFQ2_9CAUD|nr:baseplate wedge tail fiber connector [Synechococcus phage ACG-2014d]
MAKEILQLGNSANDGTGDSLRAGGTKVNSNFTELYDSLGGTAGATASLISTASPNLGDALTWNGTSFSPGIPRNKNLLEENLNVNGYNIVSSANGNVLIQSDGTGNIVLRNTSNSTDTIIDGTDGFFKWRAPYSTAANLPVSSNYDGMFAYVSDVSKAYYSSGSAWVNLIDTATGRIQDLSNVEDTTYTDGEVPTWNAVNGQFEPGTGGSSGGGNIFATFNADTGSTTALGATDTLTVTGGTDISTTISGDTLTIAYSGGGGFEFDGTPSEGNTLYYDGNNWIPVSSPLIAWSLGSDGTNSHFTFTGPGFTGSVNDPAIYLHRGHTYLFNNSGQYTVHPFEIRQSSGGSAYSAGVTNDGAGRITFVVPMDAPSTLYYQCTAHGAMGNQIVIVS